MENKLKQNKEPQHDAKLPVIASTAMVVDLDSLANVCGFFNGETPVNNHYGCNHKDCSDVKWLESIVFNYGRTKRTFKTKMGNFS